MEITNKVARNAKEKALIAIYGSQEQSFNKLVWYRDALSKSNPGTYFHLEVLPETNIFSRAFCAYAGSIEGFRHCLPVLYVDGTFGKSKFKGQILVAIGRKGNSGMYPVATAYCDSETEDNWTYFFKHLKEIIEPQGRIISFVSDRGTGLLSGFEKVFPGNPYLYCYKHLTFNLRTKFAGRKDGVKFKDVKQAFFKLAYASTHAEYEANLEIFR